MANSAVGGVGGGVQVLGKRQADDSNLNDDHRFTKRFNLLSIGESTQTRGRIIHIRMF